MSVHRNHNAKGSAKENINLIHYATMKQRYSRRVWLGDGAGRGGSRARGKRNLTCLLRRVSKRTFSQRNKAVSLKGISTHHALDSARQRGHRQDPTAGLLEAAA